MTAQLRSKLRKPRLQPFPVGRLLPNVITLAGLCCGLSAIRSALEGRWELAVGFIVIAALIDGMDGRIARLLNATSVFGAQLDSLSDFLCFGVAPALLVYLWTLHAMPVRGVGWAVVLLFAICCALRLARFNTSLLEDAKEAWRQNFFVGVPAPAGGTLCLLPMVLSFELGNTLFRSPWLHVVYVPMIAMLMASRVPTFSGKRVRITHDRILPVMLAAGIFVVFVVIEPWLGYALGGLIYLSMIPASVRAFRRLRQESAPGEDEALPQHPPVLTE